MRTGLYISIFCLLTTVTAFNSCNYKNRLYGYVYGNESANDTSVLISVDSNMTPVLYDKESHDGQTGFESVVAHRMFVKLIPNRGGRKAVERQNNTAALHGVVGAIQFLMDHDLTSGYVHPSIINFYKVLRPDDFVLRFHRDSIYNNRGWIEYVRKADAPVIDSIARQFAFFRQWRLSEIDYNKDAGGNVFINLKPSTYATGFYCPQVKLPTTNPFGSRMPEIPVWVVSENAGMQPLNHYDNLGLADGGTVVLIWADSTSHKILFKDIHGSLKRIITTAIEIAAKYHTDPTIGIYDAGRMAHKLKATHAEIPFSALDILSAGYPDYVSAGYCYVPQKQYVTNHSRHGNIIKREYEMVKLDAEELIR